jgi:hypothetical protein
VAGDLKGREDKVTDYLFAPDGCRTSTTPIGAITSRDEAPRDELAGIRSGPSQSWQPDALDYARSTGAVAC